jgi:hypothetical protein
MDRLERGWTMTSNINHTPNRPNFDDEALIGAVMRWVAEIYPGQAAHLESAAPDPNATGIWHATALLSNGVRFRFTLAVPDDRASIQGVDWLSSRQPVVDYDMARERQSDG